MSTKLDKSLDEILTSRRSGRGGRRVPPRRNASARAAPVGGVSKNTTRLARKPSGKAAGASSAGGSDSKIIVSNLPPDVSESQIKEYFIESVGPVKRVSITYGPNGSSRGIATIIFSRPGGANDAAKKLNGILVDKRPMKIEVVVDASRAPPPEPAKTMSDRITKAKDKPKQAGTTKVETARAATRGGRGGGRGARRGRNAGRPKPKTAEQLDAEMTDYFVGNSNAADGAAGTAPAAGAGGEDTGMDEVS